MPSSPQWIYKRGDTGPGLQVQLRHAPTYGERIGQIASLSEVSSVWWIIRREYDGVIVHEQQAQIVDHHRGIVATPMTAVVSAQPGLYASEIVATWGDGQQLTFPAEPNVDHLYIRVRNDLMSTAIPVATSGPTVGALPVPNALFIPDGSSGQVTGNGQHVFAGANATINVDPSVTHITVASWPTQTPWGAGTTPTIVHAGTTLHGSVPARLLASAGDEVTIARDGLAGAVWFASAPATGGASYTPPTINPVFIPNGGSGTVAYNNQVVFAGDAAVVNVAPGITSFSLGEWATQTPWATMPTIVQAGTSMHASVAQQLADSDGDIVVMGSNGATWFAAAPASHAVETYEHLQPVAAVSWIIDHNLGRSPAGVTIQDLAGQDVMAEDISHPTVNRTVLTFVAAQAGSALLS